MTWNHTYQTIQTMKQKLDKCGYAIKVFHRKNYHDVLCVLSNEGFLNDRSVECRIVVQDGILTVRLKEKKK